MYIMSLKVSKALMNHFLLKLGRDYYVFDVKCVQCSSLAVVAFFSDKELEFMSQ